MTTKAKLDMPKKKSEPIAEAINAAAAPVIEATGERFYPPFDSAAEEDEALVKKAEKWADGWKKGVLENMDKALKGLASAQQNRVIIMGQRICAGRDPIPTKKKEKANAEN